MHTGTSQSIQEHKEGKVARAIENQTAKLPSDLFLWAAGVSIIGSAVLQFTGKQELSNFVGQWAPTLLVLGLYNKLVKQLGSDQTDRTASSSIGSSSGTWSGAI